MPKHELTDNDGKVYLLQAGAGPKWPDRSSLATCSISAGQLLERFDYSQFIKAIPTLISHLSSRAALASSHPLPVGASGMRLVAACPKQAINDGLSSSNLVIHQLGTTEVETTDGDDKAILKVKIHNALAEIIAQEKLEARQIDAEHQKRSWFGKELAVRWHFATGIVSAGADLAKQAKEVYDVISMRERLLRITRSAYKAAASTQGNDKSFTETFANEQLKAEKRELVEALGFDPTTLTMQQFEDAFEVAELIWDDIDMRALLGRFGSEYVRAQHELEIAEMAGGVAFEVILTLLLAAATAGAGLAASAVAQTRHVGKFGKVGKLLMEFGEALRDIKRKAQSKGAKANKASASDLYTGGEEIAVGPITRQIDGKPNKEAKKKRKTADEDKEEIANLAKAGKITEAREVLQPHIDAAKQAKTPEQKRKALDEIIARLDVSSEKDKVFWSGNKKLAGDYASNNGGTILEQTPGGSVIDDWDDINEIFSWKKEDMPPHGWDLWGEVSENYADGASGNIETIQTAEKFPKGGPTWETKEWPSLYKNPEIGDITINKIDDNGVITDSITIDSKSDEAFEIFGDPI